jgi:hypothetical protein
MEEIFALMTVEELLVFPTMLWEEYPLGIRSFRSSFRILPCGTIDCDEKKERKKGLPVSEEFNSITNESSLCWNANLGGSVY